MPTARYDTPERVVSFYRELLARVRALPGVEAAGVVRVLPLATTIGDYGLDVEGYEERPGADAKGDWQIVSDGAFEAMGTRLVRGRWFTAADTSESQPVAVVNETLARLYFKDGNAVGGRAARRQHEEPLGRRRRHRRRRAAQRRHGTGEGEVLHPAQPVARRHWRQSRPQRLHRGRGPRATRCRLAAAVRGEVRALDPTLPVANVRPMTEVVAASLATPRLTGFLLGTFAVIALLLAAVGIYGVLAYLVSRRTHEIGIRLAIGADRGQVVRMVLGQGIGLAALGLVAGIVGAVGLTRLMASVLYEVTPADPWTYASVVGGLLAVAARGQCHPGAAGACHGVGSP